MATSRSRAAFEEFVGDSRRIEAVTHTGDPYRCHSECTHMVAPMEFHGSGASVLLLVYSTTTHACTPGAEIALMG